MSRLFVQSWKVFFNVYLQDRPGVELQDVRCVCVSDIESLASLFTSFPRLCLELPKDPLVLYQIMREIQEHKIKIYEFPETDDEEENRLVKKIKVPYVT